MVWPLVLVAVAFASPFRFGPNVAVSYRWTLVGGAGFAVGWLAATAAFSLYVAPERVQARRDETAHARAGTRAPGPPEADAEPGPAPARPHPGRHLSPRRSTGAGASSTGGRTASRLFAIVVLVVGGAAGAVAGLLARGKHERATDA